MSAQYEILPPGGHEAYATSIFSKIKTYLDSNPYGYVSKNTTYSLSASGENIVLTGSDNSSKSVSLGTQLLPNLPVWTAEPTDDAYLIWRDIAGTNAYGQVKFSTVWNYIKRKADSVYVNITGDTMTGNLTAPKFIGALQGNADTATSATTASKLGSSNVGSATQPIYLNAGTATACTYTLGKSVPSNAVFTDTKNTAGSTNTSSKIFLIGATSQAANPRTYSHDTAYVGTDGCLYSGGTKVLTAHQSVTDNNPTLSWGTKSKVATIGGTAINVTMPSNPNTDANVKQTPVTNQTGAYRILFSCSADDTEHTEGVYKFSGLTYDPDPSLPEFIFSKKMSDSEDTESPQMRLRLLDSQGVINEELSITSYDIFNQQGWGGDVTVKSLSTILSRKVNKAGDTISGTLLRDTVDGTSWNMARDHAFIRSHGFANNGSWFPAVSFLTTGGSWAIGSLSNSNNFWFSYTRNNEYTNNINKTDNYQLVPVNDGNAHTYTIAHSGNVGTGDSNGQIKIAGTNVGVKGLGSAAYYNAASSNTASTVVLRDANRYIYAQYYNAGCGADNSATNSSYFVYSDSDGWIRKASRLNFAKALTDSHVTSPGFFVTLTNSWGSFGYSTAAETRSAIGALSTSGGTVTGHLAIGTTNTSIILRTKFISRVDTADSNYVNFVNTENSAYAPIRASAFTNMSCKHTKTNVVDISEEDALKLLDIRPVNFDYVEEVGGQKDQIGVLAEDTYEVLPKVVSVPDDYVEEDFDISKGIHQPLPSVDYAKFVPYLIKMVQIQERKINELKTSLNNFMQHA